MIKSKKVLHKLYKARPEFHDSMKYIELNRSLFLAPDKTYWKMGNMYENSIEDIRGCAY